MGEVGVDSVVVEGWSACFLVGFVVVFFGKIVDFGELILTSALRTLPKDLAEMKVFDPAFMRKLPLSRESVLTVS